MNEARPDIDKPDILLHADKLRAIELVEKILFHIDNVVLAGLSSSELAFIALFYTYAAKALSVNGFNDKIMSCVDLAICKLLNESCPSWLFGGITGTVWILDHITRQLCGDVSILDSSRSTTSDPFTGIDELLIDLLNHEWTGEYDLSTGITGLGIYFMDRTHLDSSRHALGLILRHLEVCSERSDEGITWCSRTSVTTSSMLLQRYDLGVAHGIPAIITLLAELTKHGVEAERSAVLLEGALKWLYLRERPPTASTRLSIAFEPGLPSADSPLAWCYGDLGVCAVLTRSAKLCHDVRCQIFAQKLNASILSREVSPLNPSDPWLCHGALGVAHIYNRLSGGTLGPNCRKAATRWYKVGMSFLEEGDMWFFREAPEARQISDVNLSFINGLIGAGLALTSLICSFEPRWDRLLLLSNPYLSPEG